MRAYHLERDLNRKYCFYIFCGGFFGGLVYICFGGKAPGSSENSTYADIDVTPRAEKDDEFKRAPEGTIPVNPAEKSLRGMVNIVWTEYDADKSGDID